MLNIATVAESKAWLAAWEADRDASPDAPVVALGRTVIESIFPSQERRNAALTHAVGGARRKPRFLAPKKKRPAARRGRR